MRKTAYQSPRYLSALLLIVLLAGCASSPSPRYYTLKPVSEVKSLTPLHSIGIQPVIMPSWLDQTRISWVDGDANQIVLGRDRWAGPLSQIIDQIILRNFSRICANDAVVSPGPWARSSTPDRVVTIRILALERRENELSAEIAITITDQQRKALTNTFRTYNKPLPESGSASEFAETLGLIMGQMSLDLATLLSNS